MKHFRCAIMEYPPRSSIEQDNLIEKITSSMLMYNGKAFATSTQTANYFKIRHDNLLSKIRNDSQFNKYVSLLRIKERKRIHRGREYPYFELDEHAFVYFMAKINTKKSDEAFDSFISAFKIMAFNYVAAQATIKANKANDVWIEARCIGKITRKALSVAIKEFCVYAEEQRGSSYPNCPYYSLITDAIYNFIGIKKPKGSRALRDVFSGDIVEAIENAEDVVIDLLNEVMATNGSRKGLKKLIKIQLDILRHNNAVGDKS